VLLLAYNILISVYIFVSQKPRKSKVIKDKGKIEFSLGDAGPSKYEIMTAIAKHHTVYGATVWLNAALPQHDNKTPAELMLEGKLDVVVELVKDFGCEGNDK
jgi:hypothetical protein